MWFRAGAGVDADEHLGQVEIPDVIARSARSLDVKVIPRGLHPVYRANCNTRQEFQR
jgi:hypothetical protein